MLTSDREINRDFDVNNLFLNLDFQHQEETFEYKWPLLDHPSNYQMIITKLLTRTSLPYIKLHETKRTIKDVKKPRIGAEEQIFYDYMVKLWVRRGFDAHNYIQNIFTYNYSGSSINDKCYVIKKYDDIVKLYDYIPGDEIGTKKDEPFYWFNTGEHRDIYSLNQIYQMINHTLSTIMNEFIKEQNYYDNFNGKKNNYWKKFKWVEPIFFIVEDNVPQLHILSELLTCLLTPGEEIDTEEEQSKIMRLYFSKSLFKFFKGLPIKPCSITNGEYCKLEVTMVDLNCADEKSETIYRKKEDDPEEYEIITIKYKIFKGEKLNIMELSDYIGIAVTSPDFPIKEQIYPQFDYDFEENFFKENRRRYLPYGESLIVDALGRNNEIYKFGKQNVTDLLINSTGDKLLFVKYFDPKTEDLNAICYENNNSATTLKMDLMNVMPLKKFTLRLYLIDRYNNFEPLYPKIEGYDDVIKLQLLFTRIKGIEKENRNIIETKKEVPERYIMDLVDLDDNEDNELENNEPENENEPEITNEPEILPDIKVISVPAITKEDDEILPDINVIPVPAINIEKEQDSDDEDDDIEAPPEKRIYLENKNEDSENENELY